MADPQMNGKPLSPNFSATEKIDYYFSLLDQGFWLLPLHLLLFDDSGKPFCSCDKGYGCGALGKHPVGQWSKPLDPKEPWTRKVIEFHVTHWPSRGMGIHAGLSKLAFLDCDPKNGGNESINTLFRGQGLEPPNPTVWTGSGGRHWYFLAPDETDDRRGFVGGNLASRTAILLANGLENFFGQHFLVLPYSPHKSGKWYSCGPAAPIGPLPEFIKHLVASHPAFVQQAARVEHHERGSSQESGGFCAPSVRAARAYVAAMAPAIEGQGGSAATANVAAKLLIDFGLEFADAFELLREYNLRCVPPWTDGELRRKLEWADKLPGPRGTKGTFSRAAGLSDLDRLVNDPAITWTIDLQYSRLTYSAGGACSFEVKPLPPVDYSDAASADDAIPDVPAEAPKLALVDHEYEPPCNCRIHTLMRERGTCNFIHMHLSARRWSCPCCGPRRRRHIKATINHHLDQWERDCHGDGPHVLWRATVPREALKKVGARIRSRAGDFFRIDPTAMGDVPGPFFLAVSTVRTSGIQWEAIDVESARALLCAHVDAISCSVKVRIWRASWGWKLLPDREPDESRYEHVSMKRQPWCKTRGVLEAHGIVPELMRLGSRFYTYTYHRWTCRADQVDDLLDDLEFGEPLSRFHILPSAGAARFLDAGTTPEQQFLSG